jgi:hypothetical protein
LFYFKFNIIHFYFRFPLFNIFLLLLSQIPLLKFLLFFTFSSFTTKFHFETEFFFKAFWHRQWLRERKKERMKGVKKLKLLQIYFKQFSRKSVERESFSFVFVFSAFLKSTLFILQLDISFPNWVKQIFFFSEWKSKMSFLPLFVAAKMRHLKFFRLLLTVNPRC